MKLPPNRADARLVPVASNTGVTGSVLLPCGAIGEEDRAGTLSELLRALLGDVVSIDGSANDLPLIATAAERAVALHAISGVLYGKGDRSEVESAVEQLAVLHQGAMTSNV
jgi:hypothetical protein